MIYKYTWICSLSTREIPRKSLWWMENFRTYCTVFQMKVKRFIWNQPYKRGWCHTNYIGLVKTTRFGESWLSACFCLPISACSFCKWMKIGTWAEFCVCVCTCPLSSRWSPALCPGSHLCPAPPACLRPTAMARAKWQHGYRSQRRWTNVLRVTHTHTYTFSFSVSIICISLPCS